MTNIEMLVNPLQICLYFDFADAVPSDRNILSVLWFLFPVAKPLFFAWLCQFSNYLHLEICTLAPPPD